MSSLVLRVQARSLNQKLYWLWNDKLIAMRKKLFIKKELILEVEREIGGMI